MTSVRKNLHPHVTDSQTLFIGLKKLFIDADEVFGIKSGSYKSLYKDDVTYFCIFSRPLEKAQNDPDFPTLPLAFRSEMTGFYLKIKKIRFYKDGLISLFYNDGAALSSFMWTFFTCGLTQAVH